MTKKATLLILIFIWIVLLVLFIKAYKPKASPPLETTEILIAKTNINANHPFLAEQASWKKIPMTKLEAEDIQKEPNILQNYLGNRLLISVQAHQVLKRNYFAKKEGGALAQLIAPGKYAMTISLNAINNKNLLITPGDKVDVFLTRAFSIANTNIEKNEYVAQIIVANVHVLAVNNKTQNATLNNSNIGVEQQSVTLEVSAHQAETLAFAQAAGILTFSIHSDSDSLTNPSMQPISNKSMFPFPKPIQEYHGDKVIFKPSS